MENEIYVTWEVGQLAEARCFAPGFRGAWFRCKITGVCETNGHIERVHLKYYDYIDDKPTWLKLYQVTSKKKKELMLRPRYPQIYNAKTMPHASAISEVSVIFDGSWKVGDFVDWWSENCYWSGTITQLLGDGKAEIELKPPPHGEGEVYVAEFKDLRPSLDWCPEYGWTMPKKEGDSSRPSAWLSKPEKRGEETKVVSDEMKSTETSNNTGDTRAIAGEETKVVSDEMKSTETSNNIGDTRAIAGEETKIVSDEEMSTETKDTDNISSQPTAHKKTKRTKKKREDYDDSKTESGQAKTEPKLDVADKEKLDSGEDEKGKGGSVLNSARSDTLEAAVMDLEEYLNKVKWLKIVLEQGISPPDDKSEWQFVEPLVDHEATR
ncbi:Agenet domain-containing protein [Striga hermonthica]|uniref:Agenet domain-containing protein n=1 Tax=Striga hermonthica TaxID=68872 RepID=A0A9N7NE41_STRHE|nr:Agenet domain-containing protein [Striga hermonthica]